jgi:xanthine dehydrogenase YagT iron-sulfur-binding subunit
MNRSNERAISDTLKSIRLPRFLDHPQQHLDLEHMPEDSSPPSGPSGSSPKSDVSRRLFLQTIGISAATVAAERQAANADAVMKPGGATIIGPMPARTSLQVNGRQLDFIAEPATTLLEALRERCDITGPKEVCDRAACGGCTVLLDERPVASCMMLALDATDRKITTVEGIGTIDDPDPLQVAMAEFDAMQCGFCTPGVVTSAKALLVRNPRPTLHEIRAALSGNLCRCGAYPNIFNAVLVASGQEPVAEPTDRGRTTSGGHA